MEHYDFPKIELHLHLDGSVDPRTSWELAKEQGAALPTEHWQEYKRYTMVTDQCKNLYDYLSLFNVPGAVMHQRDALVRITRELVQRLASQGVVYGEIRYAPQNHLEQGLTQQDSIEAVLEGARQGMERYPAIRVGIILCMLIHGPVERNDAANRETVELAARYLDKGVVALDLAGAEGKTPMIDFAPYFARAQALGVPFTIHAGEAFGAENVRTALAMGARRIGHGVRSVEDPALVKELAIRQIPLEVCVTSNLQCNVVPDMAHHPIRTLFEEGVAVTVNTDNMVISNTSLDEEYQLIQEAFGFTREEIIQMNITAAKNAFLPQEERDQLVARLKTYL